jgi:putative oxidoreductase
MTSRVPRWLRTADRFLIETTRRIGIRGLRVSLGVVFIWFGGLKVFRVSPVESLVTSTLFWLPPNLAIVGMGALEILVGLGLLTGWAIRLTLLMFFLQMAGTFAVFVILPGRMFLDGNPLLLTQEGEFVIKNLILVTAGLVVAGAIPTARPEQTVKAMLTQKPRAAVARAKPRL